MNNKTNTTAPAQGAQAVSEISVGTIEGYLKKDLSIALNCLDAIYRDPDLLRSMAEFMHGRFMNAKNAEQAQQQAQSVE